MYSMHACCARCVCNKVNKRIKYLQKTEIPFLFLNRNWRQWRFIHESCLNGVPRLKEEQNYILDESLWHFHFSSSLFIEYRIIMLCCASVMLLFCFISLPILLFFFLWLVHFHLGAMYGSTAPQGTYPNTSSIYKYNTWIVNAAGIEQSFSCSYSMVLFAVLFSCLFISFTSAMHVFVL